ncbi:type II toxin-antitoxin system HipA family toxin [Alcaligenaceae bacterium]|nr:type II toxin-antitoxin system HipA family toxin [Alcaligenaceae bacterium]
MKRLEVFYEGWGENWHLGSLADANKTILFEYSAEALQQGLELSPRNLPLQRPAFQGFKPHQWALPGLIADSLPDGWGLLVMDRLFRKRGIRPESLSPLNRLAFIGSNSMGALTYKPADSTNLGNEDLTLLKLAQEAQAVAHEQDTTALNVLARLGGSPHGARPKVLIHFNPKTSALATHPFPDGEPWLVKFQAGNEHPEVCAIELLYAQLARAFSIEMPETWLFELNANLSAFGIKRFDRKQDMRVPILTLAGALDLNFRMPAIGYDTLLKMTRFMTRNQAEVDKAYRRAVFNVAFHNRDDHSKNFSYRLDQARNWQLAPGYDLTFNEGPGGEHFMDISGEGRNVTKADLIQLAKDGGVNLGFASTCIDEARALADNVETMAKELPIRKQTRNDFLRKIRHAAGLLV